MKFGCGVTGNHREKPARHALTRSTQGQHGWFCRSVPFAGEHWAKYLLRWPEQTGCALARLGMSAAVAVEQSVVLLTVFAIVLRVFGGLRYVRQQTDASIGLSSVRQRTDPD